MTTPVTLHQEISVRRATHDGYIWLPAKVVWFGENKFYEMPSGKMKPLDHSEEGKTWRIEG